jgi:uncharacterized membrane protein
MVFRWIQMKSISVIYYGGFWKNCPMSGMIYQLGGVLAVGQFIGAEMAKVLTRVSTIVFYKKQRMQSNENWHFRNTYSSRSYSLRTILQCVGVPTIFKYDAPNGVLLVP